MKQKTILFICPDAYRPDLPNFHDKYEGLSGFFAVHVLARSRAGYDQFKMGSATLHVLPIEKKKHGIHVLSHVCAIILAGGRINKAGKIDVIVSSDPLTLGIASLALKILTGARLIVEINGHLTKAAFLSKESVVSKIRRRLYDLAVSLSIRNADAIKLLNPLQYEEWRSIIKDKPVFTFHDYVPTHVFRSVRSHFNYIFFAGHPFYTKGVDILIRAFKKVASEFPDMKLIIIGHNRLDLDKYMQMANDCPQVEFRKPVDYDEIVPYFQNCTFFVLPSRSEAMGRVLIEAMAAGKAVIASRIDGIPFLLDEGRTGLLFESENVDELSEKMGLLLSDEELRMSIGRKGYESVRQHYSSELYAARFREMIEAVLRRTTGSQGEDDEKLNRL